MLDGAELEGASLKKANLVDARITVDTTTKATIVTDPDGKYVVGKSPKEIIFENTTVTEHSLLYADLEYFSTKVDLLLRANKIYYSNPNQDSEGDIFTRGSEIRRIIKAIPGTDRLGVVESM